jgi:hypothetical protein
MPRQENVIIRARLCCNRKMNLIPVYIYSQLNDFLRKRIVQLSCLSGTVYRSHQHV